MTITQEDSIPHKTDSYRLAESLFYRQFNDLDFYVEDSSQENLYWQLLRKLFGDIKITKIYPLGGKKNVIEFAKTHSSDLRSVCIVDKDFDALLGAMNNIGCLFYLKRYSIEIILSVIR